MAVWSFDCFGGGSSESEYQRGFDNGLRDYKEIIETLYTMPFTTKEEIFGTWDSIAILCKRSMYEIKEKIEEYERKKKEPKVGDIYTLKGVDKLLVITDVTDHLVCAMYKSGNVSVWNKKIFLDTYKPTGKNIKSKLDCVLSELE